MNANDIWRNFELDGVSASGAHEPVKQEIREWGTWVESIIAAFISTGGRIYQTRAALYADLAWPSGTLAWVMEDTNLAYNGIYRKTGASGSGVWVRAGDLPFSFVKASVTGGTANAVQVTTTTPYASNALFIINGFSSNSATPVTISINGGPVLTVKTASDINVPVNGMPPTVIGTVEGSNFRLASDIASASIVAAAEAAAEAAAGYAAIATKVFYEKTFTGNGTPGPYDLLTNAGGKANVFVYVDGYPQFNWTLVDGTKVLFDENIPVTSEIRVKFGSALSGIGTLGTQDAGTVVITGGSATFDSLSVKPAGRVAARTGLGLTEKVVTMAINEVGTFVPVLKFGGASVGITYGTANAGWYTRMGNLVFVTVLLVLTSKGTSVGQAVIGGLPFPARARIGQADGLSSPGYSGMTGLASAPWGTTAQGTSDISVFMFSATAQVALTDAQFTNTSALRFSGVYDMGSLT